MYPLALPRQLCAASRRSFNRIQVFEPGKPALERQICSVFEVRQIFILVIEKAVESRSDAFNYKIGFEALSISAGRQQALLERPRM